MIKEYFLRLVVEIRKGDLAKYKENPAVGDLAENIDIATEQEKQLNQDIHKAMGNVTSNVAAIIQQIRDDKALD